MLPSLVPLLAFIAAVSMATTWLFQGMVWRRIRRRRPAADFTPPLSILKPLAGVDEGLLDNLRSIAAQDYPEFEILFGIEDPQDPARAVVEQLRQEYPKVPMRLVLASPQLGRNPKVNSLAGMAKRARHEHFLISDANVRVKPHYLRAIAAELADTQVGLVCNVIAGSHAQSIGALFEDLHLNTFIAAAICGAMEMGHHPCVVGKSMLLRRADLHKLGGWHSVRNILAEDYVLGQRFHEAGWKVLLSSHVVGAVHMRRSLKEFVERHVRWAQMRRRLVPGYYLGEALLNPTPWAVALLMASIERLNQPGVMTAITVMALKCLGDFMLVNLLTERRLALWQVMTIPFKDCLVAAIWTVGAFRRRVNWRGHAMLIGQGSVLYAANEESSALMVNDAAAHAETL